jgi:dynamin 1/3
MYHACKEALRIIGESGEFLQIPQKFDLESSTGDVTMATYTTPLPAPVKNDWLPTGDNPRLSPPSPGGPRKNAPVSQVRRRSRSFDRVTMFSASQGSLGSQGRGPPPPAGGRPAPAIPNRPGGGKTLTKETSVDSKNLIEFSGAAPPVPGGRPTGQALPAPLIPS